MATRYLAITTGTVTWNSTASWSASDGGATGASIPVSGDTVYILRGNAFIPGQDLSAVVLANLYVSFQGTIGSSGSPFKIGLDTGCNSIFSGDHGDVFIAPFLASAVNGILSFLGNGMGNVTVMSNSASAQGTYLCGQRCRVNFSGSFEGTFTVVGLGNVNIEYAATACLVSTQSGRTICSRSTGAATVLGGVLTITGVAAAGGITVVYPQGVLNYQATGTIANLTTNVGAVANSAGAPGAITVTNSTKWVGSKMFDQSAVNIVYTNPTVPRGYAA